MSENSDVARVVIAYVVSIAAFWTLFLMNKTHHWFKPGHFIATAIGVGLVMCLGSLLWAVIRQRASR